MSKKMIFFRAPYKGIFLNKDKNLIDLVKTLDNLDTKLKRV